MKDLNTESHSDLTHWSPPPFPPHARIAGDYCWLEPLTLNHVTALFTAFDGGAACKGWKYLPYGPFDSESGLQSWIEIYMRNQELQFYTICDREQGGQALGVCSYLRINPERGSIEVGHIHFSPTLQRTRAATEAMKLMMQRAFELGYRRYEWKCNALNIASRSAAQRLGLSFEGILRQWAVVKGKNRNTAWYAAIDREWPQIKSAFDTWLAAGNFTADEVQKKSLSLLTRPILVSVDEFAQKAR